MIECKKVIRAPQNNLFSLTQNYEIRNEWDPFPESYGFLNGNQVAEGLQLTVIDKAGRSMTVEYISYKPPTVAAVKMIAGPWYIKDFAGSWSFKELGTNKTLVVFKYNITAGVPVLGVLVNLVFKWNTKRRLAALKLFAEAGIPK